jgi:hypothetical protein
LALPLTRLASLGTLSPQVRGEGKTERPPFSTPSLAIRVPIRHHAGGPGQGLIRSAGTRGLAEHAMTISIGNLQPLVAIAAGILILIMPRLLNYIVAIYLIVIGILGLGIIR